MRDGSFTREDVVLAEGGDLRVLIRRARQRSAFRLTVAGLIVAPLVLVTSPGVGASTTHAPTRVPNVLHDSKAQVYAAMTSAGLFFRTDGPGSLNGTWRSAITENPQPGTLVAWHATVIVATSLAAPSVTAHAPTRVPDVVHDSKARVYAALARAGLYFVTHGPGSADGTWTTAVAQSPAAGTLVAWHATVTLGTARVRLGAARHATTRVPHLVGLTRVRALAALSKRGLLVRTRGPGSANDTWTAVVAQNVRPGTTVAWHSVVLVTTRRSGATRPPASVTVSNSPVASDPVTTTTTTTASSGRSRLGLATWYAYFPGRCATSYLPKGTVITVRDVATGRTVRCEVTDLQAKSPGRVVDLSATQFSQLAPLWRGVVFVEVTW